ncbi:hypothetical protein NBRC110019_25410 [Neptunitalea chrysea]|uniref:Uncharacterized protein n=1 Tax=Neptunitalea chrysea TaxID=1647581 RepID=A0A9W6B6K2_9FLAO|nr:hypothetical protein [Neptunitalea chrysea]GLB53500.1 hypothetical protein NBRC110019_25410 [Neptunitalea chrysea]
MELSKRAKKYLDSLKRDKNYSSGKKSTTAYLEAQLGSDFEEFIKFQVNYSGYKFTIKKAKHHNFSAELFTRKQVKKNKPIEVEKMGDRLIAMCGYHLSAPFSFFITDKGEFCTLDDTDMPHIIHSSFEKFIETYALKNKHYKYTETPYYTVKNSKLLEEVMSEDFKVLPECSDDYSTWWKKGKIIAVKGIWLDQPVSYFHVYSEDSDAGEALVQLLKDKEILE